MYVILKGIRRSQDYNYTKYEKMKDWLVGVCNQKLCTQT